MIAVIVRKLKSHLMFDIYLNGCKKKDYDRDIILFNFFCMKYNYNL